MATMNTKIQYIMKKLATVALPAFLIALAFFAGFYVNAKQGQNEYAISAQGGVTLVANKDKDKPKEVDFSEFWKVWNIVQKNYVDVQDKGKTDQDKVYGAIKGMVESLDDPYTEFFTPKESKVFDQALSGSLEGVGMSVEMKEGVLVVRAPLKGSPAERAGVMPGDKILKIGDKDTNGLSIDEAVAMIRGKKGTIVTISFGRAGKTNPIVLDIKRELITLPIVETKKMEDEKVFVITLNEFTANSATLFKNALKEFVDSKYDKLVLDLRNNGGGYLQASVDIASWFIGKGKIIVVEDFADSATKDIEFRSKGYNIFNDQLKMVVLVNGGTASASEILSAALRDNGVAKLVGTKTFGKGVVQEVFPLSGGASVKVTIAKWLTAKGLNLSKEGLIPDVEVVVSEEDVKAWRDPQMKKAIEILNDFKR